jgi:small subunit ribosomal protein S7
MLRTIPRTICLRTFIRYAQPIAVRRPLLVTRRQYAEKKSPPDNDTLPPVSDYIASQSSPSNSEIPADRMPHQTEEDIATEKILNREPRTGNDGLPRDAVPVEQVFKGDPEAMKKAPEAIKDGKSSSSVEGQDGLPSTGERNKMPHVTEESIATERIISGSDNVPGATDSTPGEETPAAGVPIEDVIGDGEKPAVMEESSKNDRELPPSGQSQSSSSTTTETTKSIDGTESDDSVSTTRKSILDLFGPASSNKRKSVEQENTEEPRFNPLKSHQLEPIDSDLTPPEDPLPEIPPDVDLAAWEENVRQGHEKSIKDIDPEEWAISQRGFWEEPTPLDDSLPPPLPRSRHPRPSPVRPRRSKVRTVEPKIFEAKAVTPWDYFYPAPKTPKTIEWAKQTAQERENPHLRQPKEPVYDPFAEVVKPQRWPFLYNRDQLLHKCVNHLMTHGKKARAEKVMQQTLLKILEHNPRVHPVTYLAEALDRNSPIVKNSAGRSRSRVFVDPIALFETQRIRIGWKTLIDAAGGKPGRARNREGIPFADRLAREIIKVMEGRGPGLANRLAQHKTAMINKLSVTKRMTGR